MRLIKWIKSFKSSVTGQFVPAEIAMESPETTIQVRRPRKKAVAVGGADPVGKAYTRKVAK